MLGTLSLSIRRHRSYNCFQVVLYFALWNSLGFLLDWVNVDQLSRLVSFANQPDEYKLIINSINIRLGLPCLLVPSTYFAVTLAGSMGMMGMW